MNEPKLVSLRRTIRKRSRECVGEALERRIVPSGVSNLFHLELNYDTQLMLERLSGTQYSGGVSVTDTKVFTNSDVIPRFVAEPTISAVRSGLWSDPNMWSLGRVPTDEDRVAIGPDISVVFAEVSNARIDGLEISGSLSFWSQVDTRMIVGNLMVMPTGRLEIGSVSAPVNPNVTAELIIADRPLDPVLDPQQFGTGLIAFGEVTIHGAELNSTWLRLAAEPKAGDDSLLLSEDAADWRAGAELVLPDTRQVPTSLEEQFVNGQIPPQWEQVIVDRVEGNRVYLTAPLQFDHLGARNAAGQLELLPHVAVLDRNVIIRSENPLGTRGHTLFAARADVDIRFARFKDLGRTDAFRDLDNTQFDASGNVTHLGTNQVARYAVHFHHLMGPENPTNTGYQFQFVGNTVEGARKWAVTVHGASYGLLDRNVVYDAQGAGFVTEDGSEIENVFSQNIAIRIQGTHQDGKSGTEEGDYGRGGVGFWFRRSGNDVSGNVAANCTYAGFVLDGYYTRTVTLPKFRGAEKNKPDQGIVTDLSPLAWFFNDEAYGMTRHGLWAAYIAGDNKLENQPLTTVMDSRFWNIYHSAVMAYHTANVTFERLLILGDISAQDRNDTGAVGMNLRTYENIDLLIRNTRIEGVRVGILAPRNDGSQAGVERPTVIFAARLKNYINILVAPPQDNSPYHGNVLEVRDTKFELVTQLPDPASAGNVLPPSNIYMWAGGDFLQWTQPSIVRVYNYNRVAGDDFQVFYHEQAASFVLPQTDPSASFGSDDAVIGSPVAGLTNALNWALYGLAMGGMVAPPEASASRVEIHGLVGPIQDLSALEARPVIVTPLGGASVPVGEPVHVRYNVIGLLPPGAQVYFRLDDSGPIAGFEDGLIYKLSPGEHWLSIYFGDENGEWLPGTSVQSYMFTVIE